jgi:hypothetical protein
MLVYLEVCSEIVRPNKTAEIDEHKFGWRKYHNGRAAVGLWVLVFG